MADNYRLVASSNPTVDWTTEVILDRDDETGEVTKSVSADTAAQLNQDDLKLVKELGFEVEKVSQSDAEKLNEKAAASAGSDVASAAPLLGDGQAQSSTDQDDAPSASKK